MTLANKEGEPMALTEEDLPVLSDVIRFGNKSIIRSSRLQRVENEPPVSRATGPLHVNLPAHLHLEPQAGHTHPNAEQPTNDDALELLIDTIIDKHITSLRHDLRALLEQATNLPDSIPDTAPNKSTAALP